ncbi:MAG: hypothetical protein KU28_01555 [Sulfurovum sp. PC08-66]|nr:MAG: hypothetical protein KU28_01555 [Sulfurovum sp. PC08-66]KIM12628.1 MAG: hypothetical protein KU37_01670 [Sulfuricurvum sp. PC08-66]
MKSTPKPLIISFEKLDDLAKRVNFFNTMRDHQRSRVLRQLSSNIYAYKKGEQILREGDDDTDMYILLSGSVTVAKGKDEFFPLGTIVAGDFFGEISFIMKNRRLASVVANEDCIVLRLCDEHFGTLELPIQMAIKDKILVKLITRLDKMNKQVIELHQNNAIAL